MGRDGGREGSALPQVWHVRPGPLNLLVGLLNKNRLLGSSPRDSDSAVVGRGLKAGTSNRFQAGAAGQGPLQRSSALGLPAPTPTSVGLSVPLVRTAGTTHECLHIDCVLLARDYQAYPTQSLGAWNTATSR